MVMQFDPYGALMSAACNRILAVFHLFRSCSMHNLHKANSASLAYFVSLTFWFRQTLFMFYVNFIVIYYICLDFHCMTYSKYKLITLNMLYFLKKIIILHPYLPITASSAQRSLSSGPGPKVAVVERFHCVQERDNLDKVSVLKVQ